MVPEQQIDDIVKPQQFQSAATDYGCTSITCQRVFGLGNHILFHTSSNPPDPTLTVGKPGDLSGGVAIVVVKRF